MSTRDVHVHSPQRVRSSSSRSGSRTSRVGAAEAGPPASVEVKLHTDCLNWNTLGSTLRYWLPFVVFVLLGGLSLATLSVDIVHMFDESGGQTGKAYETVSGMNLATMIMMILFVASSMVLSLGYELRAIWAAAKAYRTTGEASGRSVRGLAAHVLTRVSVLTDKRDRAARLWVMSTSFAFATVLQIIAFAFIVRVRHDHPKLLGVSQGQEWDVTLLDGNGTTVCSQCVLKAADTAAACETMRLLSWVWGVGFSIVANALVVAHWAAQPFLALSTSWSYPLVEASKEEQQPPNVNTMLLVNDH